jgi:hypothetical protein
MSDLPLIMVRTKKSAAYSLWGSEYDVHGVIEELKKRLMDEGGSGYEVIEMEIKSRRWVEPTVEVREDDIL